MCSPQTDQTLTYSCYTTNIKQVVILRMYRVYIFQTAALSQDSIFVALA